MYLSENERNSETGARTCLLRFHSLSGELLYHEDILESSGFSYLYLDLGHWAHF